MSKMGGYCKAYSVQKFREFEGWTEADQTTGKQSDPTDGMAEEAYLYLQENFTVTEGVFIDEAIVFYALSPEWIEFCKSRLRFAAPVH